MTEENDVGYQGSQGGEKRAKLKSGEATLIWESGKRVAAMNKKEEVTFNRNNGLARASGGTSNSKTPPGTEEIRMK